MWVHTMHSRTALWTKMILYDPDITLFENKPQPPQVKVGLQTYSMDSVRLTAEFYRYLHPLISIF